MKTATFTSTISPKLLTWVTKHASVTNRTRRVILEEALMKYREEEIRQQMREDFTRAAKDEQTLDFSEWGMEDFQTIITS